MTKKVHYLLNGYAACGSTATSRYLTGIMRNVTCTACKAADHANFDHNVRNAADLAVRVRSFGR